ncbi:MAG: SDR family NAD(P)-dependent oxidoreductase [Actinomycetota bacterium]
MKGRRTLITGAASGIGKAIAKRFAEAGSELILVDINRKGLKGTDESINHYACSRRACILDLSKKAEIDNVWEEFGADLPDILINNAGIYPFKNYMDLDEEFLEKLVNINLSSVVWMCQNFIKKRGSRGGIIINLSSIEAILPFKDDMAHYSLTKSGIIGLTRSLARDYGKMGYRANVILPGAIRTPGTDNLVKLAIRRFSFNLIKTGYDFQSRLALGRWGYPDEVAKAALFLASDMASYVQGALLPVDGGFLSS